MTESERLIAGWIGAAHDYGHAAEALGLEPFPLTDDTNSHEVVTVFALRVAQVLAKALVDMHIADVNLRGNTGAAECIARTVMMLLPNIEAEHNQGRDTPVADLLETLLRASRTKGNDSE